MPTQHWKGPTIPMVGDDDDLLDAWPTAFDTAGIITGAASIAAARVMLTTAEAAGHPITTATPVYFDIGGIIYKADGTKNASVWVLKPANEVEHAEDFGTTGGSHTLAAGAKKQTIASTLPARPYDRMVMVTSAIYGGVTAGGIDVWAQINSNFQYARLPGGESSSGTAINIGLIPAGTAPGIYAGIMGAAGSGGTVSLSSSTAWNTLAVLAFPISMA